MLHTGTAKKKPNLKRYPKWKTLGDVATTGLTMITNHVTILNDDIMCKQQWIKCT